MQFKINGDTITITGADGELDAEQFHHVWYTVQQAHDQYKRHLTLIKARDVIIPAGMAWLDEHYPDHVQRVDLSILDMVSPYGCPLAQASGESYWDAVDKHDLERGWRAYQLGFIAYAADGVSSSELAQLWIEAYEQRRSLESAS